MLQDLMIIHLIDNIIIIPDGAEPRITGPTPLYNCLKPPD